MSTAKLAILASLVVLAAAPAQAYIGPGAGAGTIAVVLGVLAAVVMAFFGVLWYPIKRLMRKKKAAQPRTAKPGGSGASS